MGLFDFFKHGTEEQGAENTPNRTEMEIYSGMRVEVTTMEGHLLFVARLMCPRDFEPELQQYSALSTSEEPEPMSVKIRGYLDREKKAVYMEGTIIPQPERIWRVENLIVVRTENDRAFFRLNTNIDATATIFEGDDAGEKPCKLLNISVGGAFITSRFPFQEGDTFLLKFKLMESEEVSSMYCQVLRIIDKETSFPKYGCQFLALNEADQARIAQSIFTVQRKQRHPY
ncbi:MAG: PilZ domain-containing protein [Oscillibacter sp.]|nr:PilZ domain-containing protein [Oscillibacter sp.]